MEEDVVAVGECEDVGEGAAVRAGVACGCGAAVGWVGGVLDGDAGWGVVGEGLDEFRGVVGGAVVDNADEGVDEGVVEPKGVEAVDDRLDGADKSLRAVVAWNDDAKRRGLQNGEERSRDV